MKVADISNQSPLVPKSQWIESKDTKMKCDVCGEEVEPKAMHFIRVEFNGRTIEPINWKICSKDIDTVSEFLHSPHFIGGHVKHGVGVLQQAKENKK